MPPTHLTKYERKCIKPTSMSSRQTSPPLASPPSFLIVPENGDDDAKMGSFGKVRSNSLQSLSSPNAEKRITMKDTMVQVFKANKARVTQDEVQKVNQMYEKMLRSKKWTFDPQSTAMKKWDTVMLLLLLFTATATPYEVSYLETSLDTLFFVNRLVDFGFVLDMGVQFFLSYVDLEGKNVTDHKLIAEKYMKSWFGIDVVSILPYDILGFFFDNSDVSQLKLLRVVRLLRLLKLLRLIKAARILKRYESQLGISFAVLALVKFLVMLLTVAHWSACAWYITGSVNNDDPDRGIDTTNWIQEAEITDNGKVSQYIYTIYFAVCVIFSGSPPGQTGPTNDEEHVVAMLIMGTCGLLYAYVIGSVCNIVSNMDLATKLYEQSMDHLNSYMTEVRLPQDMRVSMRLFFMQAKAVHRSRFYTDTLKMMSPKLRKDIALHCHRNWMRHISFFLCPASELEEESFQADIALALTTSIFSPSEYLIAEGEFCETMFIIQKGIVARLGRVLGQGRFVGEDVILHSTRRPYSVRTLTFVITELLRKKQLFEIAMGSQYPLVRRGIRRSAIKLSVCRFFVNISKDVERCREFVANMQRAIRLQEAELSEEEEEVKYIYKSEAESRPGSAKSAEAVAGSAAESEQSLEGAELKPVIPVVLKPLEVSPLTSSSLRTRSPLAKTTSGALSGLSKAASNAVWTELGGIESRLGKRMLRMEQRMEEKMSRILLALERQGQDKQQE